MVVCSFMAELADLILARDANANVTGVAGFIGG